MIKIVFINLLILSTFADPGRYCKIPVCKQRLLEKCFNETIKLGEAKNFYEAELCFDHACKLDHGGSCHALARMQRKTKRYKESIDSYIKACALKNYKFGINPCVELGEIRIKEGNIILAEKSFLRGCENKDARSCIALAKLLDPKFSNSHSKKYLKKACKLDKIFCPKMP